MLWLIIGDYSHQIVSCNLFSENGKHQLWVTRPNNLGLKVKESDNIEEIRELKEAIDFAIENKYSTFKLS